MQQLKQKTIKGIFWSGIDSFGVYLIKFGFGIAIARLLSPVEYGIVGLMAIFMVMARMISTSGLSMALIQKRNATDEDSSTVFLFNLSSGIILYIILFFCAPLIGRFFNEPQVVAVARVVALALIIDPFANIQSTILSKELNFKRQAIVQLPGALVTGSTGLTMAYSGFGVWALVFQTLSGSIFRAVSLWIVCKWRPSLSFDYKSFKSLYHYGWKIFLQGLSNSIFDNIYYPIIGKVFGASLLGYYTRARSFYNIFVVQFSISFGRVIFPALSSISDDKERMRRGYFKSFQLLIFFVFPAMTILIITAEPFISLALTEKWLPAVPYVKLLYAEGFLFPLFLLNQNQFAALGRSDLVLILGATRQLLMLIGLVTIIYYDIRILLVSYLIASLFSFLISIPLIRSSLGLSGVGLLKSILLPLVIVSASGLVISNIADRLLSSEILLIVFEATAFIIVYAGCSRTLNRKAYDDAKLLLKGFSRYRDQ